MITVVDTYTCYLLTHMIYTRNTMNYINLGFSSCFNKLSRK